MSYRGRFAPSPTGPLHAGSLVAALASWLDARAHGGRWLVRIEDVDRPRCVPGMDHFILHQLARCGLVPDEAPWWQCTRGDSYATSLQNLLEISAAFPCGCTRADIHAALAAAEVAPARFGERVYPGTCRAGLNGKSARAVRFLAEGRVEWTDRRLGAQQQNVATAVGDFVLKRADGLWAYQLAVVVDDAAQSISHVVRGEDLADNTARQILLQRALGLATPQYLHTPLVLAVDGHKLSKQNGATALALDDEAAVLRALHQAARVLGLDAAWGGTNGPRQTSTELVPDFLARAVQAWAGIITSVSTAPSPVTLLPTQTCFGAS